MLGCGEKLNKDFTMKDKNTMHVLYLSQTDFSSVKVQVELESSFFPNMAHVDKLLSWHFAFIV